MLLLLLLCLLAQDYTVLDSGRRDAKLGGDAVYERITDEAAFKALWERLPSSDMKKEMPKVDFRTTISWSRPPRTPTARCFGSTP